MGTSSAFSATQRYRFVHGHVHVLTPKARGRSGEGEGEGGGERGRERGREEGADGAEGGRRDHGWPLDGLVSKSRSSKAEPWRTLCKNLDFYRSDLTSTTASAHSRPSLGEAFSASGSFIFGSWMAIGRPFPKSRSSKAERWRTLCKIFYFHRSDLRSTRASGHSPAGLGGAFSASRNFIFESGVGIGRPCLKRRSSKAEERKTCNKNFPFYRSDLEWTTASEHLRAGLGEAFRPQ